MKKRVLSLLMAVAMCLSMLPATALAEELGTGAAETQTEQQIPEEPKQTQEPEQVDEPEQAQTPGVPEGDPEELETPPAPEKESGEAVKAAQALIDALPDEVTADNADELEAQLIAIEAALAALTEEQYAQLDMTRYHKLCEALANLTAEQANSTHTDHALCTHTTGTCSCPEEAKNNAFTDAKALTAKDGELYIGGKKEQLSTTSSRYELSEGSYYLEGNIELSYTIQILKGAKVNLCLNGHSITKGNNDESDFDGVIMIEDGGTLSLCDCKGGGTITHAESKIGRGVKGGSGTATHNGRPTFNMFGGEISGNHAGETTNGYKQDGAGVYMQGGYFNMYGGKITDNHVEKGLNGYGGGVRMDGGTFTMYGGEISKNTVTDSNSSYHNGGGIYSTGSVTIKGGTISGNTAAQNGGGIYATKDLTISGNAVITGNTATSYGGGVYYSCSWPSYSMTVSGSAQITKNNAGGHGGGVYCSISSDSSSMTVSGSAQITENSAGGNGGGVYYANSYDSASKYPMTVSDTAKIEKNTAANGGGIYVSEGDLNLSGNATITQNTATTKGGGVYYIGGSAKMTVSGSVQIIGNTGAGGKANNVYVPNTTNTDGCHPFTIGEGGLGVDAKLGITYGGTIELGKCITVALHAERGYKDGNFTSDSSNSAYSFKREADHEKDSTLRGTHVVNLYNGLHEHPICGKTCGHSGNEKHTESLTWTGVSSLSEINKAGNYYLTTDVELTSSWSLEGIAVNLCLNGHSITRKYDSTWQGAVITVTYKSQGNLHGKLALCDCNGSGKSNGVITHAENAGGVGVQLEQAATFDMYGGSITRNNGYGVNVGGSAAFHMYGGSITGNSSGVNASGTMTVSGDVQITDNKKGDTSCNVDLTSGKTIKVSGALSEGAKIGVKVSPPDGSYVTVAKGTDTSPLTEADLNRFKSDITSYGKKFVDGSVIFYNGTLHKHAVCGAKSCTEHTSLSDEVWQPLTYKTDDGKWLYSGGTSLPVSAEYNGTRIAYTLPAGNYYLSANITTDLPILITGDVNLCLNGYTITTTANLSRNGQAFIKSEDHALTICDCNGSRQSKGEIKAPNGTNVGIMTTGALTMYGGKITGGNTGVYVHTLNSSSVGTFHMYGGTITGNTAGVSFGGSENTLTVGGSAKITDNTDRDVSLPKDATITIDGLKQGAQIGVYFTQKPSETEKKQFATGAAQDRDFYAAIFSCSNGDDYVLTKDEQGKLYFGKHQHVWSYTASGATITATCTAPGCPNTNGGSVTLSVPSNVSYDGQPKKATLRASNDWLGIDVNNITVTYSGWEDTTYGSTTTAPTNAGKYQASITLTGGGNNSVTVSEMYEIKKATPQASDFTFTPPTDLIYDGQLKTASVVAKTDITGMGEVVVNHYQDGGIVAVQNAGDYIVKISVKEGTNYKATTADLTADGWAFTISKNMTTPTVTLSDNTTYTGQQITPTVTVTVGGKTLTEGTDYTVTYGENINAGEQAGSVTITAKGNYGFNKYIRNFSITKRYIEVKADDKSSRVGKDLKPLTYMCVTEGLPYEGDNFTGELATIANKNTAGTYDITQGSLSLGDNYNIDFTNGTYTVNAKDTQTKFKFAGVEGGKVTKTYGDAVFKLEASGQVDGSSVSYESSDTNVATVDSTGKVTIIGAGTTTIKATASATDDYAQGVATYELTISPKTVTITGLAAENKVYDGNGTAKVTGTAVIDGKVGNDDVSVTAGTAKFSDKNVGTGKTVTFSGYSLSGAAAGNYTLSGQPASVTANITAKEVTLTSGINATDRSYVKDNKAVDLTKGTLVFTGLVSGETLDVNIPATGTISDATVGTYNVTYSGVTLKDGTTGKASNYKLVGSLPTVTATVTKADAPVLADIPVSFKHTVTTGEKAIGNAGIPADAGTLTYFKGNASTTGTVTVTNWGVDSTGKVTYTLSGGKAGDTVTLPVIIKSINYADATVHVKITLTAREDQAALKLTGGTTVVYGQTLQLGTSGGSGTGAVTYTVVNGTGKATINANGVLTPVKVGTVKVSATKAGDTDYNEVTSAAVEITIQQATPTGVPGYTKITSRGRTLTDVGLTAMDGEVSRFKYNNKEIHGDIYFVDDNGNRLDMTTPVESGKAYKWVFVPSGDIGSNFESVSGTITPWESSGIIIVPTYPTESGNVSNPSTGAAPQGGIACGVAVLAAGICLLGAKRKRHE